MKIIRSDLPLDELARYACNDCDVNVVTAGEFYMISNDIWFDQLGLGCSDNLCIGCLEARIGRRISGADIIPSRQPRRAMAPWMKPPSIRLQHRLLGRFVTKRPPYRWRKSDFRNKYGLQMPGKALAKTLGEYAACEAEVVTPARRR